MDFEDGIEVVTASGKSFHAHRCYVNDVNELIIALYNISMIEAVSVFGNPEESNKITCFDHFDANQVEYDGYTSIALVVNENNLNGIKLYMRKQ